MSADKTMIGEGVNKKVISAEKTVSAERVSLIDTEKKFSVFQKTISHHDHIFRLIEYDEGVPFQLVYGEKPGDGHYTHIGNGIEMLVGIQPSCLTERNFLEMVEDIVTVSGNVPSEPAELQKRVRSGEISEYRIEMLLTSACGEKKWIRETSIPVRDEETGMITGVIGILHDISDKRRVSEFLHAAKEKESEIERLKSSFLQNISHEVRTPLNAIIGFSTLLCEPESSYQKKKEFVSMINNSTDHFLEVMDNIMEISRIETGTLTLTITEVDPVSILTRAFRSFIKRAEDSKIDLICNTPHDEGNLIKTDSYKLYQIINNLVGNALKFTLSGKVEFGFINKGKCVEFYVTDTGIGIPELYRPLIFNKFYQVDSGSTRRFPGIGLGLSISKAYIEMLGGNIDFISEEGSGSTFRFNLPKNI